MSTTGSSLTRPVFANPFHFSQTWGTNGWFCNVCTPLPNAAEHKQGMTIRAAMRHECSAGHVQKVSKHVWHPKPDFSERGAPENQLLTSKMLKVKDKQNRVDNVRQMVPWWVRAVEAAERGEQMRMEDFLDSIEEDPWAHGEGAWECPDKINGNDWAYGPRSDLCSRPALDSRDKMGDTASSLQAHRPPSASSCIGKRHHKINAKRKRGMSVADVMDFPLHPSCDPHNFVEEIARQEAADAAKKRQMHLFIDMPTHEKVEKIQEIICYLRPAYG